MHLLLLTFSSDFNCNIYYCLLNGCPARSVKIQNKLSGSFLNAYFSSGGAVTFLAIKASKFLFLFLGLNATFGFN